MDFASARAELIAELSLEIKDERVLKAMAQVPREFFLPPASRALAYDNRPLPIGYGQTISQPFIVALMTSALGLSGQDKVLEVGTGSGYQATILSLLAQKVVTVERVLPLAIQAESVLRFLGYKNVEVMVAEKTMGWPAQAPYDAIVVTAGAPRIPQALLDQLKMGGRLVIPVGGRYDQELLKVVKGEEGLIITDLGACRFVPLVGPGAWEGEEGDSREV